MVNLDYEAECRWQSSAAFTLSTCWYSVVDDLEEDTALVKTFMR